MKWNDGTNKPIKLEWKEKLHMYALMERAHMLYNLLQDELSKNVFKARLAFDFESTMTNAMELLFLNPEFSREEVKQIAGWKKKIQKLQADNKKFVIYGAGGLGRQAAHTLLNDKDIDFYGFCGRKGPEGYPNGKLMGKPVISPDYLIQHSEEFYIAICAEAISEIETFLQESNFPQCHILRFFNFCHNENQYFEFPSLYQSGTAFIDGGCLNCHDDYTFAAWCHDSYSNILAFEPDSVNYKNCQERLNVSPIRNLQLIQAGLAETTGEVVFSSSANGGSHIQGNELSSIYARKKNQVIVKTYALDELVDKNTVGFIKLDVEGAELDTLHGAQKTIMRDKPFLALSVYHRKGDALALMDFLHQIVPEYRFWLRHYGPLHYETVLYASTNRLR